jgi:hypothetical protein
MDRQTVILGLVLIVIGTSITAKTWTVPWNELIRALVWHPRRIPRAYMKSAGLVLLAVGALVLLAGLGCL